MLPEWFIPTVIAALVLIGAGLALLIAQQLRRGGGSGADAEALTAERARREAAERDLAKTREDLREAAVRAQEIPRLEQKLEAAQEKLEAAVARAHEAERKAEALQAQIEGAEKAHREKVAELVAFRADMEKQFKALSNEALNAQSEHFTKSSKERLETMLSPLKEQITKFEGAFKQDGETRAAQSSSLRTLIDTLHRDTAKVQEEAGNLARALKGSSQTQGAWGEMILRTILEKAGLREGEEFVTQDHQTTEEGARLRPDVVVNFPDGKKLVVDSKVSLTAFERCVNCEDEAERAAHLKEHLTSLRRHIKGLSGKDYAGLYGGVDFVILFVPVESALSLAIQNDPELQSEAVGLNVMIASPNTLLMGLRTVQNMWTQERQHQNAEAIADRAGKLYDKFVGFVDDLEKIGSSIDRARSQYDDALGKLSTGRGNLVGQAEKLKKMGGKTTKKLPQTLLARSEQAQLSTRDAKRHEAQHPEKIPSFNDETAESYEDMTEEEKQVAAAISQDTDA